MSKMQEGHARCRGKGDDVGRRWVPRRSWTQARRNQRQRQTTPDWQVAGLLTSEAYLGHEMSRSLHLVARILKVHREALTRFSHIHRPDSSNSTLLPQSHFIEMASSAEQWFLCSYLRELSFGVWNQELINLCFLYLYIVRCDTKIRYTLVIFFLI